MSDSFKNDLYYFMKSYFNRQLDSIVRSEVLLRSPFATIRKSGPTFRDLCDVIYSEIVT
jgi:hypothetical protein